MIRLLKNKAVQWAAKEATGTIGSTLLRGIGRAILWPFAHFRLLIEYALILGVISLAGTVLVNRTHMAEQDTAMAKLDAEAASRQRTIDEQARINAAQDLAIQGLQKLRKRDEVALLGLHQDLRANRVRTQAVQSKLTTLEKNNAAAKSLLDIDIPNSIGCVLDGRPCPAHASSAGRNESR